MSACVESVFPALNPIGVPQAAASSLPSQADPAADVAGPMPSIVHVAIDSFFASVEQAFNPRLRGRPVLVGRTALVSASPEAQMMGVRPTMTAAEALDICPNAAVLPGRYGKYAEYAEKVLHILGTYRANVDVGSRDDFYLDFSRTQLRDSDFRGTLLRLQMDVFDQTGLSVSVGAGRTRVVADIASQLVGPRGFRIVPLGTEDDFLAPLAPEKLPGLESQQMSRLRASSVQTIADVRRIPLPALQAAFGQSLGVRVWHAARGRDNREKSLTTPQNWLSREAKVDGGTADPDLLNRIIAYLSARISVALLQSNNEARTVGVGLAIAYADQYSAKQSSRLLRPSASGSDLQATAQSLCRNLFTRPEKVQQIRVEVTACAAKSSSLQTCVDGPELALAAGL
jgi:DNA polymerase-4